MINNFSIRLSPVNKCLFIVALAIVASFLPSSSVHAVTAGDWRAGNIIDDVVFYNQSTMNIQQIQQFLNSKVPVCDSNGTQSYAGTTRAAYSQAHGVAMPLTCLKDYYENPATGADNLGGQQIPSGGQSAAQIIWEASQDYHINPQVLITLIQREQGLVTDDWPWPVQFKSATGYSCPDTGPDHSIVCGGYFGFALQVRAAAWQFQQYAAHPNSYNFVAGVNNSIQWSPQPSCGSGNVFIQNQATAGLYDYAPYQPNQAALNNLYGTGDACSSYAQRNFWRWFNDWFGSSTVSAKWLRQSTANGQVWLVVEGQMQDGSYARKKWKITSSDIYVAYGLQYDPVALVSEDYLAQFTDDGVLGTIATSKSYAEFQFFDSGRRYYIPGISYCKYNGDGSVNVTTSWGFDCFNTNLVKTIPGNEFLERIPGVGAVPQVMINNNVTYKLQGGQKAPIYDEQTLFDMGYNWSNAPHMQDINAQQPLGPLQISHAAVVSFNGGPFLVYDNTTFQFHNAGTGDTFDAWGLYRISNTRPATSSYNLTPPTIYSPELSIWATSGGHKYIVDGGRKIDVTAAAADMPASTIWQPTAQSLLDQLPTALYGSYAWDKQTGGVYMIENGQKRHVPNWSNLVGLGIQWQQLLPISHAALVQIPDGPNKLADGSLFQTSAGGVFMVNGGHSLHVPTWQYILDWRLNVGDMINGQENLGTAYPSSGELDSLIKATNGERFMVVNGQRLAVGEANRAEWGIPPSNFVDMTGTNITRLPVADEIGRFFLHGGGIYYGQGGQKHYIQSYGSFVARGGDPGRLYQMPDDVFNAIPSGTPIP